MHTGNFHRLATGFGSHRASRLAVFCDSPLDDSTALEDPLVRRLDANRGEVMIRHHVRRYSAPRSDDSGDWSLHADSASAPIAGAAA